MTLASEIGAVAALAGVRCAQVRHWLYVADELDVSNALGVPILTPLITFTVPSARCLLITKMAADSYPVSGGVDLYSHRQQQMFFNEGTHLQVYVNNALVTSSSVRTRYVVGEILLVLPADAKVEFLITIPVTTDAMKLAMKLHGFLLPQRAHEALAPLQTVLHA